MKKVLLSVIALALASVAAMAQDDYMNPIITAMPSLTITPDARAGGMGEVGVATQADLNSQHWNPAKYAFMESHGGITANYTPWLRKIVGDIDLAYLAGYYKWDDVQGISASFTYFSLGKVDLTDIKGSYLQEARPNEWAIDVAYSRKLHEYVSMAVALRFLYSDLNNGANSSTIDATERHSAWTMAADVSLYYRQPIQLAMGMSYFALGLNISNLGGKMTYDKVTQNFIPANLRLGVSYELPFNQYNSLTFNVEANKMMVPTRISKYATDVDGNPVDPDDPNYSNLTRDWYSELLSMKGLFQSFADAPKGSLEEFQEVQWNMGLEYSYDKKFFARFGYSYENRWKGNRRFFTFGAGFHLSIFSLDAAYTLAASAANPLDNTLRFTLGFDLAGIKDLVNNRK